MLTPKQASKIEYIVLKLKKSISQIDVVNWLSNFKKEDWDTALEVLTNLDFFDSNDITAHFEEKLNKICKEIEDYHIEIEQKIKNFKPTSIQEKGKIKFLKRKLRIGINKPYLIAVGNYGKSGTAMMYYATHIPKFNKLKIETLKLTFRTPQAKKKN